MAVTADDEPGAPPTPGPGLPPGLAAAWGERAATRRGPKPALTLEQIVSAAVSLADSEGLGAVSMSRVADAVGFTTMSLYRYVASKDDLLLLMGDAAYGEPPAHLGETDEWRFELEQWAHTTLATYRQHPWVVDLPINGPPAAPNVLLWLDRLLQGLRSTALDHHEQLGCALVLSGYVRDWASLTRGIQLGEERRVAAGAPPVQYSDLLAGYVTTARYPALAPMIAGGEFDDDPEVEDFEADQFPFGLDRVLDGFAVLIERRAAERDG